MKKLKEMNVKKEDILNRDEMMAIMAGSGSGTCSCTSDGGCGVAMAEGSFGWSMTVCCDGDCETYEGSGPYGGTACGGACP